MRGRGRFDITGIDREEVVYKGRYVVVTESKGISLMAYPREDPRMRERQYLLDMMGELLAVSGDLFKSTGYDMAIVRVRVRRGDKWHGVAVRRDYGVWIVASEEDYVDFIRRADRVEVETASGAVENSPGAYRGRYVVVVEGKGGMLHAYARSGTGLGPGELMARAIKELVERFGEVRGGRDIEAVAVHGLVWRHADAYVPMVYSSFDVKFVRARSDHEHFVRTADEIVFTRLSARER